MNWGIDGLPVKYVFQFAIYTETYLEINLLNDDDEPEEMMVTGEISEMTIENLNEQELQDYNNDGLKEDYNFFTDNVDMIHQLVSNHNIVAVELERLPIDGTK